jgi:hypothetical protein
VAGSGGIWPRRAARARGGGAAGLSMDGLPRGAAARQRGVRWCGGVEVQGGAALPASCGGGAGLAWPCSGLSGPGPLHSSPLCDSWSCSRPCLPSRWRWRRSARPERHG